ncbi:MAG: hypothetical protein KGL68_16410 [Burkholderiales bacterium]|nr:hypothetical protein [Burkholderiales bacterium]
MPSHVVYDIDYDREVDQGLLAPEQFDYWFLCEGDSWMDRSSLTQMSLPWSLARSFRGQRGNRALFVNLSHFGDTLRHIGDCLNDVFHQWVTTPLPFRFDALLLSAGGNDFIDAALDPPPGQGLLRDVHGAGPDLQPDDCFDPAALSLLVDQYLDPNFGKLYDTVRASPFCGAMPILLNLYATPVARYAPVLPGGKTWLSAAYAKNGIPPALWPAVTQRLFVDVEAVVTDWSEVAGRTGVFTVPTSSVPLVPADPGAAGSSGDWLNEIHPNKSGWARLATAWQASLDAVL